MAVTQVSGVNRISYNAPPASKVPLKKHANDKIKPQPQEKKKSYTGWIIAGSTVLGVALLVIFREPLGLTELGEKLFRRRILPERPLRVPPLEGGNPSSSTRSSVTASLPKFSRELIQLVEGEKVPLGDVEANLFKATRKYLRESESYFLRSLDSENIVITKNGENTLAALFDKNDPKTIIGQIDYRSDEFKKPRNLVIFDEKTGRQIKEIVYSSNLNNERIVSYIVEECGNHPKYMNDEKFKNCQIITHYNNDVISSEIFYLPDRKKILMHGYSVSVWDPHYLTSTTKYDPETGNKIEKTTYYKNGIAHELEKYGDEEKIIEKFTYDGDKLLIGHQELNETGELVYVSIPNVPLGKFITNLLNKTRNFIGESDEQFFKLNLEDIIMTKDPQNNITHLFDKNTMAPIGDLRFTWGSPLLKQPDILVLPNKREINYQYGSDTDGGIIKSIFEPCNEQGKEGWRKFTQYGVWPYKQASNKNEIELISYINPEGKAREIEFPRVDGTRVSLKYGDNIHEDPIELIIKGKEGKPISDPKIYDKKFYRWVDNNSEKINSSIVGGNELTLTDKDLELINLGITQNPKFTEINLENINIKYEDGIKIITDKHHDDRIIAKIVYENDEPVLLTRIEHYDKGRNYNASHKSTYEATMNKDGRYVETIATDYKEPPYTYSSKYFDIDDELTVNMDQTINDNKVENLLYIFSKNIGKRIYKNDNKGAWRLVGDGSSHSFL